MDKQYTCDHCHDTRETTVVAMCGGVEMDCDDQPCPWCADEESDADEFR